MTPLSRIACFAVAPLAAGAIWESMTVEDLVQQSDLIVVAELGESRPVSPGAHEIGVLRVSEVLVGPRDLRTAALGVRRKGGLVASDEIVYRSGQRGIWFLKRAAGDAQYYLADHPQRLMPLTALEAVRKVVLAKKRG